MRAVPPRRPIMPHVSFLPPDPLLMEQYSPESAASFRRRKKERAWKWLKDARAEAWADIRTRGYRRAAFWVLLPCWQAGLLWSLITITMFSNLGFYEDSTCRPDGTFSVWGGGYSPWFVDGFFQITLGFGTLDFTQAKIIDIVWDIVCLSRLLFHLPYLGYHRS